MMDRQALKAPPYPRPVWPLPNDGATPHTSHGEETHTTWIQMQFL